MLAPIDDKSTTITGGWTRDGKRVYVTSNANDRGIDAVALLELKQGPEFQWLTLQDWDSQLVDVSPTEDRFAYVVNEAGNLRLLLRDLNGEEEEIPPTQGVVRAARFSPDGKRLAIIHASGDSPHDIWVYDLKARTLKQIPTRSSAVYIARISSAPSSSSIPPSTRRRSLPSYTSQRISKPTIPTRLSSIPTAAPSGSTSTAGSPAYNITQATGTW